MSKAALPGLLERAAQIAARDAARQALAGGSARQVAAPASTASFEELLGEGLCAVRAR